MNAKVPLLAHLDLNQFPLKATASEADGVCRRREASASVHSCWRKFGLIPKSTECARPQSDKLKHHWL
jgi:hypothetical protein